MNSGAGRLVLVVGPSGAGKDSVLRHAGERLAGASRFVFPRRVVIAAAELRAARVAARRRESPADTLSRSQREAPLPAVTIPSYRIANDGGLAQSVEAFRRLLETLMPATTNVLFLCTGNTARSILAEAILRKLGEGKFRSFSAGSQPRGVVNPLALQVLRENGFPAEGLTSKSWDGFAGPGAPEMQMVITVCDSAAGEACPLWPGHPAKAHWSLPDPHVKADFERTLAALSTRIAALVSGA